MAKPKKELKKLNVVWEILEATAYLDVKKGPTTVLDLIRIYRGNFVPLLYDKRIEDKCLWNVKITITYLDEGKECKDYLDWDFNTGLSFNHMLHGSKGMLVQEAGITTIWQGIGHEWKNYVQRILPGKTLISAWATATTEAYVKPLLATHRYTKLARTMNSNIRTGKYLI